MHKKMTKWPTKLPIKKKCKEKKGGREKKIRNRFAKQVQNLAYAHSRKTKKAA